MEENQNQNQNPNKKSGKGLFIFIGILIIIIAALVGYIVWNQSNTQKTSNVNNTNTSVSKKADKDADEDEDEVDEDEDEDEDDEDEDEDDKKSSKKNTTNTSKEEDKNTSKNKTSNSTFGKKDKNETNSTNTEKTEKTTNSTISSDWKSGEFIFDGASYKLNGDYKKFVDNGWSVDLSKYGYEDGYILNKNDKTYSTVSLENSKYEKAYVSIGFINLSDSAKDVSESQVWAISVDNYGSYRTQVDFELPGGIKYGSTLEEVEKAYGKPEDESDIYRSDSLNYTTYTYDSSEKNTPQLRLTIYDDGGVTAFDYKIY